MIKPEQAHRILEDWQRIALIYSTLESSAGWFIERGNILRGSNNTKVREMVADDLVTTGEWIRTTIKLLLEEHQAVERDMKGMLNGNGEKQV